MTLISRSRNYGLGTVLIVLGTFLLLDQLGYANFGYLISLFWPLLLVVLGLRLLINYRFYGGSLITGVGTIFLLQNAGALPDNAFRVFWPVIIILLGISILFQPRKTKFRSQNGVGGVSMPATKWKDIDVLFAGIENTLAINPFTGGDIDASFSGVKLNLTDSVIKDQAVLNVDITFSGLELTVPKDWKVVSEVSPIAGGITDERQNVQITDISKVLIIRGDVVFGGVSIK